MNILTFDIEEWYIEKAFKGSRKEKYALFNDYLYRILQLLEETETKATFFCLGKIALEFPEVVSIINDAGHEIGCHSHEHLWLTKMTPEQFKDDTITAVHALEDLTGKAVISYRAPAFSVGESNRWVFDVLSECGIQNDASVFPALRDFGGFPSFGNTKPAWIQTKTGKILEFPVNMAEIAGHKFAYSGGGYFRLYPYWFIENQLKRNDYFMAYFHIADVIHNTNRMMNRQQYEEYFREPGTFINRIKRYAKSHIGTRGSFDKLKKLVINNRFINIKQASRLLNT